jgi:hypothetical protein
MDAIVTGGGDVSAAVGWEYLTVLGAEGLLFEPELEPDWVKGGRCFCVTRRGLVSRLGVAYLVDHFVGSRSQGLSFLRGGLLSSSTGGIQTASVFIVLKLKHCWPNQHSL